MADQSTVGILDEFQTEFSEFWRRLPNKGFFLALLACWLGLFQFFGNATLGYVDTPSLFSWMINSYTARDLDGNLQDDSMGMWVPLLVLGLIWWKQKELVAQPLKLWGPGLLVVVCGMGLHLVGYFIQQPRLSIVALLTGIYGLMGMAWGREWMRKIFFPFFLLVFLIPFSTLIEPITFPLRLIAARIVEWICQELLLLNVLREGTMLRDGAGHYQYDVAGPCSGIRSLMAVGLMATVGSFVFFKQWRRRAVLFALVIPLAVVGNVLRLMSIIIAAKIWGQSWGNWVHEGGPGGIFSLLPYVPAIFGLIYVGQWMEEKKPEPTKPA